MSTSVVGRTVGRINEFTLVATLKPGQHTQTYVETFLRIGNVEFNFDFPFYQSALKRIGTVHFVRAVALDDLEPALLLFSTEFDRNPERYLDDFSDEGHTVFDLVLSATEDYPGARPVDRFRDWVKAHQIRTTCFWAAYDAPVRKIEVALDLLDQLEAEAAGDSPLDVARRWGANLHRLLERAPLTFRQAANVNELTIVAPVTPGGAAAVRALEDNPACLLNQQDNALAQTGIVHFARVALIEQDTMLVFALEFDGELDPLLRQLSQQAAPLLDQIFNACEGYPGAQPFAAFEQWVARYHRQHIAFYSGHGESLQRVRQALAALAEMG